MAGDILSKDKKIIIHRICARILVFIFVFSLVFSMNTIVEAFPLQGYVTLENPDSLVNVRTGPDVTYTSIDKLGFNHPVQVIGQSDSTSWYNIKYTSGGVTKEGWISNPYIRLETGDDSDFEKYLNDQRFPESYKPYLRQLHTLHPNWQFVALHTGLDWNTVVKNQVTPVYRSMVPASSISSWKSLETGAYNWDKGSWTNFEPGWVAASSSILEYFLDPRNALVDGGEILQFLSLGYTGYETKAAVENIISGTFMARSELDYAQYFIDAGIASGVSPYHLASRSIQEVGINGGTSTKGPYYNFYNINATGSNPAQAGVEYAKKMGWDTQEKAIKEGATFISTKYIDKEQDTLYLQKFDVVDGGNGYYWHQYMTNIQAPTNEARNMKKTFPNFNSANFIFKIPVYLNMPAKACVKPTSNANPNYLLSSLKVDNYPLTPVFSKSTTTYNIIVPEEVTEINVTASPVMNTTNVNGAGKHQLEKGINEIKITSTSQSGKSTTYTINVSRGKVEYIEPSPSPSPETPSPNPKITSNYKTNSSKMTGISPETNVSNFLKNINVENATIEVLNPDGTRCTGNVGTGTKVQIKQGNKVTKEWQVLIYGDNNGDGKINIVDLANIQKHILNVTTLKGIYADASNTSSNSNEVNIVDLANIQKHILNVKSIKQ